MSWLSIGTRIVPKLFKGGAKATSTLWRGSTAVVKSTAQVAGAAAKNPKTTLAVGIGSYAGWKVIDNPEQSFGTAVGESTREVANKTGNFAHDFVNGFTGEDTVEDVRDGTKDMFTDIKETMGETKGLLGTMSDMLQGLGKFLDNIFGGNGMNMFTNFFSNFGAGKVSGLGIGGLLAGCYMMFCRSGLLSKIGGAMLAMMMIGGNSQRRSNSETETLAQSQSQERPLLTSPKGRIR